MGLTSVTVTGIYTDATGGLLTGKTIRFRSLGVFGDDGAVVASTEIRVVTDEVTAAFEVELLTSDIVDAYVRYQVVFHNGSRRKFDLTDDAPTISLEDLINAYDPTTTASSSVEWLNHEARIDALELGGGGGGAITFSAGTLSGSRASIVFADSNGIGFGMSGSTITASHNGLTNSNLFRQTANDSQLRFTSADSQLQFTSANSNFLGTGATQSFRHTSDDGQLRFTSQNSQLQFTSANSNFLGTGATQSFQFTSDNALSLGTGATASFRFTSQNSQLRFTSADSQLRFTSADSQLQFTSANSNFLGTAATQSFRHTSADSQLQFTSANSNLLGTAATQSFQFTSDNSLSLGTGATASFRFTSQNSQLQFTSANSNFLGTAATQSFRHTSADTQLQFTSANSNFLGTAATQSFRHTSADSQLQFTSANTKFAQEWQLSGNTSGTASSVQGSRWYFQGGANMTISGSGQSIVFSAGSAAPSPLNFSAGTTSGNLGSVVFSNSNNIQFGLNGSTITASVPGTSSLSATGIVSISVNASTISIGARYPNIQYFEPQDLQGMGLMTNITAISSRPFFSPFILPGNLTNSSLVLQMSRQTSGSNAFTVQAGIYTYVNATSMSLLGSLSNVFSGGNTASFSGVRQFLLTGWETAATNLTAGAYVLGLNFFAAATASMNYSLFGVQSASSPLGYVSAGTENNNTTNTTFGAPYLFGRYTAQSGALPTAVAQSHLTGGISGASLPISPWFVMMP